MAAVGRNFGAIAGSLAAANKARHYNGSGAAAKSTPLMVPARRRSPKLRLATGIANGGLLAAFKPKARCVATTPTAKTTSEVHLRNASVAPSGAARSTVAGKKVDLSLGSSSTAATTRESKKGASWP